MTAWCASGEDGRWEGRIVIGHKENGAPIFHYLSARTQKELLEKLHRCIDEYDGAELTEDCRMTLGEWLEIWLTECAEPSVRPSTFRGYRAYVRTRSHPTWVRRKSEKSLSTISKTCIVS